MSYSLNTRAFRPSGPDAKCIFRLFNSLMTRFGSNVISLLGMNWLVPLEGISVSWGDFSCGNIEWSRMQVREGVPQMQVQS